MAPDADPYRTLGLSRGATLDEVKRAYRRLAKINHPDAGGEKALPRFLAIQAAYEQLIGGTGPAKGRAGATQPRRPWEADPGQADATRRAYGGRARNPAPGARGPRSDGAPGRPAGAAGATGGGTGATGENGRSWAGRTAGAGPKGGGSVPGGTTGRAGRRRPAEPGPGSGDPASDPGRGKKARPSNKATFGSTSYDGADAGPFEPDWGGASWYGTTSGTYWTLNPKEYADPRKHGPEYQARARRSARADGRARGVPDPADVTGETLADAATGPDVDPAEAPDSGSASGPGADGRPADPTHTTTSWWDSTAGPAAEAAEADPADAERPRPTGGTRYGDPHTAPRPSPDLGRAAADIASALTDDGFGGTRARLARAVIGWLPIALGLGWAVGELTGCGRFAATCDGSVEPMLLVLQVIVLGFLVLLPAAASIATTAALSLFVAAVIASLILSATGGAADGSSRQAALGLVLVIGWLIGLAFAIGRRARTLRSPARPVS